MDAWKIIWRDGLSICERCGSVVDIWRNEEEKKEKKIKKRKEKILGGPNTFPEIVL